MKLRLSGAVPPLPVGRHGLHTDKFTCVCLYSGVTPHYGEGFSSVLHFISFDMQYGLWIHCSPVHSSIYQDVFPISQWLTAVISSAAIDISIRSDNIWTLPSIFFFIEKF